MRKKKSITKDLRKARLDVLSRNEEQTKQFNDILNKNRNIKKEYLESALVKPTVTSMRIIQYDIEDEPEEIKLNNEKRSFLKSATAKLSHDDLIITINPFEEINEREIINLLLNKSNNPSLCFDRLLLGINLNRSKEDILSEVERVLDIHLPDRKTRLSWLKKWALYIQVWDERKKRKGFPEIARELGTKEATVKKRFYRAYEIIYNKPYNPADYEKPEIKKEYLKRTCETCQEKLTCKNLCPDVIEFVEQDSKTYLREYLS